MMATAHELIISGKEQPCEKCSAHCQSAFKKLNTLHNSMIDEIREMKSYKPGRIIDPTEDGSENFFCIHQGHVKIEVGDGASQKSVRICGPGDIVGLQLTNEYTIRSLNNVTICIIDAIAFRKLQLQIPEISMGLVETLLKTVTADELRLRGLENHSIKNRIAATLTHLARRFGVVDTRGTLIDVSIDRTTLAQLSGTVTESLARVLTDFEKDGIIRRQGRKIEILKISELKQISAS